MSGGTYGPGGVFFLDFWRGFPKVYSRTDPGITIASQALQACPHPFFLVSPKIWIIQIKSLTLKFDLDKSFHPHRSEKETVDCWPPSQTDLLSSLSAALSPSLKAINMFNALSLKFEELTKVAEEVTSRFQTNFPLFLQSQLFSTKKRFFLNKWKA